MTDRILDIRNWIPESEVAETLGISRASLRITRETLTEGSDFAKKTGGQIVFSPSTVAAIANLPKKEAAGLAFKPVLQTLYVRKKVPNPRILLCVRTPEEVRSLQAVEIITLRVKRGDAFVPGMKLTDCREITPCVFDYCGKTPRRKGVI